MNSIIRFFAVNATTGQLLVIKLLYAERTRLEYQQVHAQAWMNMNISVSRKTPLLPVRPE